MRVLTVHIDVAVRVAPIPRALQHVVQLALGGTHRDLAHLLVFFF